jgi:hypothetical protein
MTKEEYQRTLVRMWDSVRENCKGKTDCDGVSCCECPLYRGNVCGTNARYNVYDLISMVEEWGKEHPVETNGSRFLENYPKAEVYSCDTYDGGFTSIRLDPSKPLDSYGNCIKMPTVWWEKEVE